MSFEKENEMNWIERERERKRRRRRKKKTDGSGRNETDWKEGRRCQTKGVIEIEKLRQANGPINQKVTLPPVKMLF